MLSVLGKSKDRAVRFRLANNPRASRDILLVLRWDEFDMVQQKAEIRLHNSSYDSTDEYIGWGNL